MFSAAILPATGQPVEVWTDVDIDNLQPGEVIVKLAASGVCHSDVNHARGLTPVPTPMVLGHEGAGVIVDTASDVQHLEVGDLVTMSWTPQCGRCFFCLRGQAQHCERGLVALMSGGLLDGTPRLRNASGPIYQLGASGTFTEYTVIPSISAVKVPADLDPRVAALLACGVLTGVGAALNDGNVSPGDTVAVIGCGGVGLNIIQGARVAGAARILAVDVSEKKLRDAAGFGATHLVHSTGPETVAEQIAEITSGRGTDVVFEATGLPAVGDDAITLARIGGLIVLVGIPPSDAHLSVNTWSNLISPGRTIKGSIYGSSSVHRDIPRILELHDQGLLQFESLISKEIGLADIEAAFADIDRGRVTRSVVMF